MIKNSREKYDVIVVGGGAAGMMTAGVCASRGRKVLIIEKNKKLGEKLRISGGGRCNITNDEEDIRKFLDFYNNTKTNTKTTADQFLHSTFSQFNKNDTFKFFENKNLPLVVQARQRAFPHTENAKDVCNVLEKYIKEQGVKVVYGFPVTKINSKENQNGKREVVSVSAGGDLYEAEHFIFATGGLSHPETGSTGDGFKWLRDLGHTVAEPTPSIVPLAVKERWSHKLAGVSLSFMKITFFQNVEGKTKKAFSKTGKILFTHFGLSGPLILNSASKVQDLLYDGDVTAHIDMYPDTNLGALDATIIKVFDNNKNRILKNVIKDFVPEGMNEAIGSLIAEVLKIPLDTKVHSVSKDARKAIVALLKAVPITITGLMGFDRAVVADGGVPLTEMDTKMMRSLKCPNIFIVGDLLHINRPSGGFSLQICWTTGYVAGLNA